MMGDRGDVQSVGPRLCRQNGPRHDFVRDICDFRIKGKQRHTRQCGQSFSREYRVREIAFSTDRSQLFLVWLALAAPFCPIMTLKQLDADQVKAADERNLHSEKEQVHSYIHLRRHKGFVRHPKREKCKRQMQHLPSIRPTGTPRIKHAHDANELHHEEYGDVRCHRRSTVEVRQILHVWIFHRKFSP